MTGTDTTKCFADRLQDLIADSGKDVKTLASEIGVSSGALSKYQNDKGEPGITALYKIAKYFGVTSDYLIGISDNKKVENADIGNETGLSDEAIDTLKSKRGNQMYGIALSYLIVEHNCLNYLVNYLFEFVISETQHTIFKFVPLKRPPLKYYRDISFSILIRNLPTIYEQTKQIFISDKNKMDILIKEYLGKNADLKRCKEYVNDDEWFKYTMPPEINEPDIDYEYQQYEEVLFEDEWMDEEEEADLFKELQEFQDNKRAAIESLLAFLSDKGGANNADNPETR